MNRTPPPWLQNAPTDRCEGYQRGHAYRLAKWWATPPWLTAAHKRSLARIYTRASDLRKHGRPVQVDHIVPLRNPLVCGLHVPWNLQILPAAANGAKSNHMWPGHPYENECWVGEYEPQQLGLKL